MSSALARRPARLTSVARALPALLLAVACSEPTSPPEPFVVSLSSTTIFGPVMTASAEGPRIACGFRIAASATGPGTAEWQGATFRFFAGADRSAPLDSAVLTAEELAGAWSLSVIAEDQRPQTEWQFTGGTPFEIEFAFAYAKSNAVAPSYATTRVTCGPRPAADGGPATLDLVQVRTSRAELEVGDTVWVSYGAASATRLWQTGVSISGSFEATRWQTDTLQSSVQHTVAFRVPTGARLDLPITILLLADDIALRRATALHPTALRVVDRTPPLASGHATGQRVPTGSAFSFVVTASDNNAVRTVVWELDGEISASDSITLVEPVTSFARDVVLTARPEWAGRRARVRVRSYDDAGLRSGEWVSADRVFSFHESFAAPAAAFAFATPSLPDFHAYDPQRARFYAAFSTEGRVVGVSLESMTTLPQLTLPGAGALGVSPSGDSLFVGRRASRTVRIFSTTAGAEIGSLELTALDSIVPPGTFPSAEVDWIAPLHDGRVLVHVAPLPGVVEIDLATGRQRYRRAFDPLTGRVVGHLSNDGRRLLLVGPNCVQWYVIDSDSFLPCGPLAGVDPRFVNVPLSGYGAGLGPVVVNDALAPVGPSDARGVSVPDVDGVHHWNADAWEGRIYKVRTVDGRTVKSTPLHGQSWFFRFLPDGQSVVVLGWGTLTRYLIGGQ